MHILLGNLLVGFLTDILNYTKEIFGVMGTMGSTICRFLICVGVGGNAKGFKI